jgi:hypothetical protein
MPCITIDVQYKNGTQIYKKATLHTVFMNTVPTTCGFFSKNQLLRYRYDYLTTITAERNQDNSNCSKKKIFVL